MEINEELKSKFIGANLGGSIEWLRSDNQLITSELTLLDASFFSNKKESKVLLKSLNLITKEDLRTIGSYVYSTLEENHDVKKELGEFILYYFFGIHRPRVRYLNQYQIDECATPNDDVIFKTLDYLRIKGFATPWLGIKVDDLVKIGWIKLITK